MSYTRETKKRLLIVTPAFNEGIVISSTLLELKKLNSIDQWDIELLVIDDGSTDDTYNKCLQSNVNTIRHPFNCGVGIALRTGFMWAKKNNYDAVMQIDADGQHPTESIKYLLEKLDSGQFDIVIGSRFLSGPWQASTIRKLTMKFLAMLVSYGTGNKITDSTSGFRVSGKRAIDFFAIHYPGEYLGDTVESLVLAHHEGLSIVEIPAALEERKGGNPSHLSVRSSLHVVRVIVMIFLALIRPRAWSQKN